jgi:hypothetical protein
MAHDILRRCTFRPYRNGPTFRLTMFDAVSSWPRTRVPYRLTMHDGRTPPIVLFEGDDFGPSPMHAIDSDATVRALMGFLTLRPGDTDADYFDAYTDTQRVFCGLHAESLAACYWRGKMLTED